MRIVSGKVISGKVVVEGEPLEEGTVVIVIAAENDEAFELGLEEVELLLASVSEAEGGETVSGEEVRRRLDGRA